MQAPRKIVQVSLEYVPRVWQKACHLALKRFNVLVLHRRAGKTRMAVAQLFDRALSIQKAKGEDPAAFAYTAPYLKQAKLLAWEMIKRSARMIPNTSINEAEVSVTLPNKATIRCFGADNPDAMRGGGFDGVVLDELKDIKPEFWYEIIRPALSDRGGWALFLGTPKGINLLSELYNFGRTQDDWFTAIYDVYHTEAISPEEIASLKASMSENEFNREFMCDFSASGEDQLISIQDAEKACHQYYKITDYNFAARVLGVDVARFGDDRSVIMSRQGLVAFPPVVLQGVDNMTLAGRIDQIIGQWHPDAVFIDAGGGAGVIDRLRQMGHDIMEVQFGGAAIAPEFLNRRAEMWWGIREWLDQGGAIPDIMDLKQDLCSPTYEYTANGKRKLESKDDIKARLLRSPDSGDALALTFAHQVQPKRRQYEGIPMRLARTLDYDPLAVEA